jgi:chromate transport protein ChrA
LSRKSKNKKGGVACCIIKGVLALIIVYTALALIFTTLIYKGIMKIDMAHICSCVSMGVAVLVGCTVGGRGNQEKRILVTGAVTAVTIAVLLFVSLFFVQGEGNAFLHCAVSICVGWVLSMLITRRIKRRRR